MCALLKYKGSSCSSKNSTIAACLDVERTACENHNEKKDENDIECVESSKGTSND